MKKIIAAVLPMILCACAASADKFGNSSFELNEQTVAQLHVDDEVLVEEDTETGYMPLNYDPQAAIWMTYMNYQDILDGKNEKEFTESIAKELEELSESGFNTIYIHVSAFNDAYYDSAVYPKGKYEWEGNFDPLEIIVKAAHDRAISVHCWINPLRCQTSEEMEKIGKNYQIGEWYSDESARKKYLSKSGERWYLNPAYEEVRDYICSGVSELVKNYEIDGIHIDDYFYPETDESFDAEAFAQSGASELSEWRTENISLMVSDMYNAVKAQDKRILFGISPQGNIDSDYKLYADVRRWGSEDGFCDYMVPQLYYGFENESCPFEETAEKWRELVSNENIMLVDGICTYKIGNEDKWAGAGKDEWKENEGIPAAQTKSAFEKHSADGIAVYSYESTFSDSMKTELSMLSEKIKEQRSEVIG